ncbi:RNI-like protein [Lactarius indigo]|nr:RNI-like protein [Lactarius indigo]
MAQPTETTPLILGQPDNSSPPPPLAPVVNRIRLHGLQLLNEDPSIFLSPPASVPAQVSFKLIVLLQLYLLAKLPQPTAGGDIWEQWSKERTSSLDSDDLERRCITIWEEFLQVSRSVQEIEDCLWSAYPLEEGGPLSVRVIDVLKDPDAPSSLLSHKLVVLSLLHTWTHGKAFTPARSLSQRVLQRFASNSPTAKQVFLMIYSAASLLRPPTFLVAPFVLVAGAFFSSLPHNPLPGDTSYSILLCALSLHVLLLHLPRTPSPNFLVSPEVTLPLATLLWHEFTRTLYPGVLFYLPATLLSSFFLSVALEDSVPHFPTLSTFAGAAPMEARVTFTLLWGVLVSFMIASSALLVLFSASLLPITSQPVCPWDRYSVVVGLRSRRIFATAVASYSVSYYFPPPFNLLQILFVHVPRRLLRLFGRKEIVIIRYFKYLCHVSAVVTKRPLVLTLTMSDRARVAKRRRVGTIGAPSEADEVVTPINLPSATAFSIRTVKDNRVVPLTLVCARVFAASLPRLSKDPRQWEPSRKWKVVAAGLKKLPDSIVQTLFTMLSSSCPHLLSHDLVKEYFLRGRSITLTSGVGGERSPISKYTVGAVASMGPGLVRLHLTGFDKMTDQSFAAVISKHPSLEDLSLCGCTLVGPKTVKAAADACPSLISVNFNYTSVTPLSLVPLLRKCKERLEVLKVAGISSWLHTELLIDGSFSLPALRTFKLRQTSLSDTSINALVPLVPNVRRVDISFTDVRRPLTASHDGFANLEKLSITSTDVSPDDLLPVISVASRLRTLNVGALGGSHGKRHAFGNTSTMTLRDEHLRSLTAVLSQNTVIENVSLVGNTKLARDGESIAEFIHLVDRRLKKLNLSGLTFLRSQDLLYLAPGDSEEAACSLQELSLNSTSIDDDAAMYISCCPSLETLGVAGTRLSSEGLFSIVDACPKLSTLDLTRCRGVSVADRRRFFEVSREYSRARDSL